MNLDALLPGDGDFPSASTVDLDAAVRRHGNAEIRAALDAPDAGELALHDPAAFAALRDLAYLLYYASPRVLAVLRSLGHEINDAPLPLGYPMAPFRQDDETPPWRPPFWRDA